MGVGGVLPVREGVERRHGTVGWAAEPTERGRQGVKPQAAQDKPPAVPEQAVVTLVNNVRIRQENCVRQDPARRCSSCSLSSPLLFSSSSGSLFI